MCIIQDLIDIGPPFSLVYLLRNFWCSHAGSSETGYVSQPHSHVGN